MVSGMPHVATLRDVAHRHATIPDHVLRKLLETAQGQACAVEMYCTDQAVVAMVVDIAEV